MFDFSGYRLRQLDINQGYKPLDFGGGGITGSVNKDGRLIAVNAYHPEHGYMTLTSIPPFPDADRYDQQKVRAYRKSLVTNEGFGLAFEQPIVEREYYLIEDAIPFMRFTLADGTVAECVTVMDSGTIRQVWYFSQSVSVSYTANLWLMRAAYSQLTEGGVLPIPSTETWLAETKQDNCVLFSDSLNYYAAINGLGRLNSAKESDAGFVTIAEALESGNKLDFVISFESNQADISGDLEILDLDTILKYTKKLDGKLVNNRAFVYGFICLLSTNVGSSCMLTDHMILPLLWTRDSYYVVAALNRHTPYLVPFYTNWLISTAWRGTYCRYTNSPNRLAWARSYLANGMQKDAKAYQFDQQLYPILHLLDHGDIHKYYRRKKELTKQIQQMLHGISLASIYGAMFVTDETPADDEIPLHYHFSSHILLWYVYKRLDAEFTREELKHPIDIHNHLRELYKQNFITTHNGKQIYSYATDGEGNHYLYHDANDIPLVMMPLWGFCDKDDPIWLNTIEFAWSEANIGCYKGCLGSVHSPNAAWSLGDAQELIYCKVVGDRERYQRVWQRIEKSAQWDGALPEAYNPDTGEVVSRHWFAWTNAMVAIADNISWDWETEGEYAR